MGQKILYNSITIDKSLGVPIYLQIANAIIKEIQLGRLRPGRKMMGVKALALLLGINKNTMERVFIELEMQQWVEKIPRRGTFVSKELPETNPIQWDHLSKKPFEKKNESGNDPGSVSNPRELIVTFDDGFPDPREVDHVTIGRAHRSIFRGKQYHKLLSYTNPYGISIFRKELARYLNDTRGINCNPDNILITRGSQMAIFLGLKTILKPGEAAVVGNPGYFGANQTLEYLQSKILFVSVDDEGLIVDEIAEHCKKNTVKVVYATTHHHHPTTVTLSPSRRMRLLHLAEAYGFKILEDDYDYDFHYGNTPILPLSSVDGLRNTIYTGSFSKTISPALRIGYLIANREVIDHAARIRRVLDHQGDPIMERVMTMLLEQGEVERSLRRNRKIYRQRRDYLCDKLNNEFGDIVHYKIPEGGLAIWAKFDDSVDLVKLSEKALHKRLYLSTAMHFGKSLNALRLGFGSLSFDEMDKGLTILKSILK